MKRDSFLFTSIVIERNNSLEASERYNILYAKDFNPNKIAYLTYARDVKKEIIPALLIELSKMYYRQLNPEREKLAEKNKEEKTGTVASSYQCSNCLSIYDKRYGDAVSNIPPGVPFEELPETYKCHVCDTPKKYFVPMTISVKT
jgi:rubredoxin